MKTAFVHTVTRSDVHVYTLHTKWCADETVRTARERVEFAKKWPNFCRKCGATGVGCAVDNGAPAGSGLFWPMDSCDPCFSCIVPRDIEETRCPRCGEKIYEAVIKTFNVPKRLRWIVEMYGQDGIMEAWLDTPGDCPKCGWSHGAVGLDFFPGYDFCSCFEQEWFHRTPFEPGIIQRVAFRLFGERLQTFCVKLPCGIVLRIWRSPILDMPTEIREEDESWEESLRSGLDRTSG